MKFNTAWTLVSLIGAVAALPTAEDNQLERQAGDIIFPAPDGVTYKQAVDKCGDQTQLSCCNKATVAGDTTSVEQGLGAGLLSDLLGAGSGSQGASLWSECSKLDVDVTIVILSGQDLLNQQCKQNVACCQKSGATSVGLSNSIEGALF
ncbi:hypothetical protein BDV25DRAFT_56751 [Aspergillus avenaceus]|uniref:Hydrophobin n=1 Tax=Aspergillus avenaceus TaxID=36643 RepID=A0A5N6TI48_ASPAV|nr:hypothetical protein BDV25DRAFT_56751 [Aspergillus avenaceus]